MNLKSATYWMIFLSNINKKKKNWINLDHFRLTCETCWDNREKNKLKT
jgi:hypothetical protein